MNDGWILKTVNRRCGSCYRIFYGVINVSPSPNVIPVTYSPLLRARLTKPRMWGITCSFAFLEILPDEPWFRSLIALIPLSTLLKNTCVIVFTPSEKKEAAPTNLTISSWSSEQKTWRDMYSCEILAISWMNRSPWILISASRSSLLHINERLLRRRGKGARYSVLYSWISLHSWLCGVPPRLLPFRQCSHRQFRSQ